MTNIFDVPLHELYGRRRTPGNLGIEIEAEAPQRASNPAERWEVNRVNIGKNPRFWDIKGDGSLRNGAEYVLKKPISIEDMPACLNEFLEYSVGTKFREDSIRTSIHYHVNVCDLTMNQIFAAIVGWWLLETVIVDTQGPHRVGNLFCLRVSDADHLVQNVFDSIDNDRVPLVNLGDNVKYAALNLNAISRFNSLEFRFNRGTVDPMEINKWGCALHAMVRSFARMGNPSAVIQFFENVPPIGFMNQFIPVWLIALIQRQPNWEEHIRTNYSYAYILSNKVGQKQPKQAENVRTVRSPRIHVNPDEMDYPYDDPRGEFNGRYHLQEFSLDEEGIPPVRFIKYGTKQAFEFAPARPGRRGDLNDVGMRWVVQPPQAHRMPNVVQQAMEDMEMQLRRQQGAAFEHLARVEQAPIVDEIEDHDDFPDDEPDPMMEDVDEEV